MTSEFYFVHKVENISGGDKENPITVIAVYNYLHVSHISREHLFPLNLKPCTNRNKEQNAALTYVELISWRLKHVTQIRNLAAMRPCEGRQEKRTMRCWTE